MGYSVQMLGEVIESLALADAPASRPARIMDIGSQDVWIASPREYDYVDELCKKCGATTTLPRDRPMFPAREFFEAAGFEYWCLDIDGRYKTVNVDLNFGKFEPSFRHYFDVVVNAGTTEHVANPVTSLFVIHEMCRKEGIMVHENPMSGFNNHAFLHLTPKLWHAVIWMNKYELIDASVRYAEESQMDRANFYMDHLNYFKGLESVSNTSYIAHLQLRKKSNRVFLPPLDMWSGMTRSQFHACLVAAMQGYRHTGVVSVREIQEAQESLLADVGGLA